MISKIGGQPAWPNNKKYPDGDFMLIQIDLKKIEKTLVGFPNSGMLQIFITDEDDWEGTLYYHTDKELENLMDTSSKPVLKDQCVSPTSQVFKLLGKFEIMYPQDPSSAEANNVYEIFNKHFGTSIKGINDLDEVFGYKDSAEIIKTIFIPGSNGYCGGIRLGGYPYFTQYDPRSEKDKDDILLLQVDSENGIEFGDGGIVNAFISPVNLKNKKFDSAYVHWDCY